ncbi:MAG: hypothetical protein ACREF4_02490 [Gammaproteobacteria bacterium]
MAVVERAEHLMPEIDASMCASYELNGGSLTLETAMALPPVQEFYRLSVRFHEMTEGDVP